MNEMKNIFSYVGIIAKACVYADIDFPENLGVISELIDIFKKCISDERISKATEG